MRYLTVGEVLEIYSRVMRQSGGSVGILDLGALESAVAQPRVTFNGEELYPTIVEKASALGFSLIQNHPFVDGNKRTAFVAAELFLMLNGHELAADDAACVLTMLAVASGDMGEDAFAAWIRSHLQPR